MNKSVLANLIKLMSVSYGYKIGYKNGYKNN